MTTNDTVVVTLSRAAELTGRSYAAMYGAGLRGHIRLRRIGRRIFVPLRDLEEFKAGREPLRRETATVQDPKA